MALDLKLLKASLEQVAPLLEALTKLALLIESATESERLVAQAHKELETQKVALAQVQKERHEAREALNSLRTLHEKERTEHKVSIAALQEERQKLRDDADNKLREHRMRLEQEMEYASANHMQMMQHLRAEQLQAKEQLDKAQKSLAEMTDRVRQTLGL
jgi:hypothetical protein